MKKLESFFCDYSWLLKSGIWILIVVWAAQFSFVIKKGYEAEKNRPARNVEIEQKMDPVLHSLAREIIAKAKSKGEAYGPKEYFEDFKTIEEKKYEIGRGYQYEPPFFRINFTELQDLMRRNVGKGRPYSYDQISKESQKFSEWMKSGGASGEEFRTQVDDMSGEEKVSIIVGWASRCYFRGIFLIALLFVVRMANRKGILETILADKAKFFLAILLWPFFLNKYPHNVVKEILVEAELRRIGKTFRRLTFQEKETIIKVAGSKNFWQWIGSFRSANICFFQRSFATALVFTIVLHCFVPLAQAGSDETRVTRAGPEISSSFSVGFSSEDEGSAKQHINLEIPKEIACWDNFSGEMAARFCQAVEFFLRVFLSQEVFLRIDHVPLSGSLFAFVFTHSANKLSESSPTKKEKEHVQKNCCFACRWPLFFRSALFGWG